MCERERERARERERGCSSKGDDKDVCSIWKKQWVMVPLIGVCNTEGACLGDKVMSLTLELFMYL